MAVGFLMTGFSVASASGNQQWEANIFLSMVLNRYYLVNKSESEKLDGLAIGNSLPRVINNMCLTKAL